MHLCALSTRKYQLKELSLWPNFLFKVLTCTKPLTQLDLLLKLEYKLLENLK